MMVAIPILSLRGRRAVLPDEAISRQAGDCLGSPALASGAREEQERLAATWFKLRIAEMMVKKRAERFA